MLDKLTREDFGGRIDQPFHLTVGDDRLELMLREATPLGRGERAGGAFSLVFLGPGEPALEQGIYPLEHAELGRLELFLVPINRTDAGMHYEAVFT